MPLRLISTSGLFNGAPIPERFTCDGDDVAPGFSWVDVPSETRGFSLVCSDADAPGGTFYHWAVWNMPIEAAGLPEGMPKTDVIQMGSGTMVQGTKDRKSVV